MKNQKGITLIALIITIIVMLILVAVSVAIVINSGLIDKTKEAGEAYKGAYDAESTMNDSINVNGTTYNNISEYVSTQTVNL